MPLAGVLALRNNDARAEATFSSIVMVHRPLNRGGGTCNACRGGTTVGAWGLAFESLSPDCARRVNRQPQLRALLRLGQRIAAGAAGKAALGADGESLRGNILGGLIDTPLQTIDRFEYRCFGADQPEHDAFPPRDETKWRKVARSHRVIFEQEMVCLRLGKKTLRNPFVSAIGEMAAPKVAAAHVDADDHVVGTCTDCSIHRMDVPLDQRIGIAAGAHNSVADRRIAQQRTRDLVDLNVLAARRQQICDFLAKDAYEIGEKPVDISVGGAVGKIGKP